MKDYSVVSKLVQRIAAILLLTPMAFSAVATAKEPPIVMPLPIQIVPRMIAPEARLPIRLQQVDVRAEVLGMAAHTQVEMVFYNPNERALEGELQFPLLEGQTVTGFALDINGELRAAVPVDKAKGQQVFEDVSRARIDPALLEKTQGNNYKLRVYPLAGHGTRRVVLEFDETLPRARGYYARYRLPLQFAEIVAQLNVTVHNAATPPRYSSMMVSAWLGAERLKVLHESEPGAQSGSQINFSRKKYAGKGSLIVDFPYTGLALTATETRADTTYFYTEIATMIDKPVARNAPKKLGLIWDASGSGAAREHGRELALLDAYFKILGNVEVELVIARDRAEVAQTFHIKNGDWHSLRNSLESMTYDGATSAAALSPPKSADLNLLFSDGLSNYGIGSFVSGDAPLFVVNASTSADLPRLRALAENSGGRLLDALNITATEAVTELTHQSARVVGLHGNGAKDLISVSSYADEKLIKIAGILTEPQATVELEFINAQGKRVSEQIKIQPTAKPVVSLAANRWAALQLAQLETDYALNRGKIQRLGKQFGMVTRETSLIVLDQVADYVRYEIAPPESLRSEYDTLMAQKNNQMNDERSRHLNDIAEKFAQKMTWWEKTFPKGDKPKPPQSKSDSSSARYPLAMMAAPAPAMAVASMAEPRVQREQTARAAPTATPAAPVAASIQLKKWESDAPYAKRLRESSPENMYQIYLDERPAYFNSTAFFLDVADIFIERGQADLGLRILSNLAEMNLENRHILRILAYRLLQANQTKLALPILQQVLALSPNEPQSSRDLGLAYAADAQYQLAINKLWDVVSQPWHGRFPDVELIALAELNAIIARAPKGTTLDTSHMDARLLHNLPLDVRAVLSWDADNTDIDLWVTDPNGEKVYYANRLGYQGGSMSRDFTGGYGPEEFSLRNAKPGKYKVQAQFYGNRQQVVSGATTLMLRLSTGFGTAGQKDENIVLRLTGQGAQVDVGEFEIGRGN